jgi:hypothetical protein
MGRDVVICWSCLGFSRSQGEFQQATEHFHSALQAAQATGNRELLSTSKVNLGVSLGNAVMEEHMRKMAGTLLHKPVVVLPDTAEEEC